MNVTDFPDLDRAREEAAQWIARLDRGLSPAEREELKCWREASPANARALRQLSELWQELDVMKVLADVFPGGLQEPAALHAAAPAPARPWARAMAAGVVAALVVTGAAVWFNHGARTVTTTLRAAVQSFESALGEQHTFPLADSSQLEVNTDSLVEVVRLDDAVRELRLARGEALFSVAHDPRRPFRAAVGTHTVEAVGTAFDIRLHKDGAIDVLVTEGRVRLLSGGTPAGLLEHGQAMHIGIDGTTRVTRLDEEEMTARLAWRRGMIEFRGQPLAEALAEFSRYTPVRFEVTDPAAARIPIGGTVPAGDVEWLLEALRTNFGLESSRGPDGGIRITPQR